jgi:hypothetical protein
VIFHELEEENSERSMDNMMENSTGMKLQKNHFDDENPV